MSKYSQDIVNENQPSDTLPAVTRAMLAELLRNIAHNWPAMTVCSASQDIWSADMVRAALHDCAAILERTDQKRKPYDILTYDYGLKMKRFASDKQVRIIGVRTSGSEPSRHIVDTRVDRKTKQACVLIDDDPVFTIYGENGVRPTLLERIAVHGLLTIMKDHKRCSGAERRRRARAKKEVQA